MLQTLFSEVLTRTDWLTVWDNIFSNHPSFMLYFLVAYLIHSRKALLCTRTKDNIKVYWFLYLFIYTGRPLQFLWAVCNKGLTFLAKHYKGEAVICLQFSLPKASQGIELQTLSVQNSTPLSHTRPMKELLLIFQKIFFFSIIVSLYFYCLSVKNHV